MLLKIIILIILEINAINVGGNVVSKFNKTNQVIVPIIILNIAPILFDFFQYNPNINGVNNPTRLKAEDWLTNSYIFALRFAMMQEMAAIMSIDKRIIFIKLLSFKFL